MLKLGTTLPRPPSVPSWKSRKRDADEAAQEARAFAVGVRQGWLKGGHTIVKVNSASESDLMQLPDVSQATA